MSLRYFEVFADRSNKCMSCGKIIWKDKVLCLCYDGEKLIYKKCADCYLRDK